MSEHDVIDTGQEILAATWEERGLHVLDSSESEWVAAPRLHPIDAREKVLCTPRTDPDRPYISLVELSPGSRTLSASRDDGEFMMVVAGRVTAAGTTMPVGSLAYRDAGAPVGGLQAGSEGCTFVTFRRIEPDPAPPRSTDVRHSAPTGRLSVFDLDQIAWRPPAVRPVLGASPLLPEQDQREPVPGEVWEKSLIYPLPGDARFPISIIRFPPNFQFHRHWHTDGEFVRILSGSANFAGRELLPGAMAYNDARVVYGAEAAGPDGCEFVLIRRAWAETHLPGGEGEIDVPTDR